MAEKRVTLTTFVLRLVPRAVASDVLRLLLLVPALLSKHLVEEAKLST